jgi:hypothetical protein
LRARNEGKLLRILTAREYDGFEAKNPLARARAADNRWVMSTKAITTYEVEVERVLQAVREQRLYSVGDQWEITGEGPVSARTLATLAGLGYIRPRTRVVGYSITDEGEDALTERERGRGRVIHQVVVNFSDEAYRTLENLAFRQGKGVAEVLWHSLALAKYFDEVQTQGGRVLVERDRRVHEVIMR